MIAIVDMEPTLELIEKMKAVEQTLARLRGSFALFALLEREDTTGRWDVVVAAPWLGTTREDIFIIAQQITNTLAPDQAVQIARIVPLRPDSDFVKFLQAVHMRPISSEGPWLSLGQSVLSGIDIRRGIILASNPLLIAAKHSEAVAA